MRRGEEIPEAIRWAVYKRDNERCRLCGRANAYTYSVHHIVYRSAGGNNDLDNLILLCGSGSNGCHLKAHSDKGLYEPLLQELVTTPGITGLALLRRKNASSTGSRAVRGGVRGSEGDSPVLGEPEKRVRTFFVDRGGERQPEP
jgi:hypothetical protein